jgi:hypothetical protein
MPLPGLLAAELGTEGRVSGFVSNAYVAGKAAGPVATTAIVVAAHLVRCCGDTASGWMRANLSLDGIAAVVRALLSRFEQTSLVDVTDAARASPGADTANLTPFAVAVPVVATLPADSLLNPRIHAAAARAALRVSAT